ncbi:MAG: chromate transporter [Lachnospiraceae bacterium]|nr:chromate transporter [Lachnospiraceae bacterium]
MKKIISLFLTFIKIGAFTFGGGYAMIALIKNEFVIKKQWITDEDFITMVAIAESTPGPIAINSATYIGYKIAGLSGSAVSTLAVCIPSFLIIYLISLFFDAFLSITYVQYAFKGIQACVIYLIFSAGIQMFKEMEKNFFNMAILICVTGCMISFSLFSIHFSSIFYILICGTIGISVYFIKSMQRK